MEDCWKRLPLDIIKHILSYDENIIIRKWGEIVVIGHIPKTDTRYPLLLTKPLIEGNRVYLYIPNTRSCLLMLVYPEMVEYEEDVLFTDNFLVDVLKIRKIPHTFHQKVLYTITLPLS